MQTKICSYPRCLQPPWLFLCGSSLTPHLALLSSGDHTGCPQSCVGLVFGTSCLRPHVRDLLHYPSTSRHVSGTSSYGDRLPIPSLSTPVVPTWARANLSPVLESARQSDSPPLCDLKTSPRRRRCTAVGKYLSAHQLNGVLLYVLPPQSSS
ncbi:hypothetical protein K438DRAFT_1990238 [Mycena galopus ATCC 62051]|nr:hypothetical protein K438DRAFT_1990238 [Mycena galopus ATCC 62051]